MNLLQEGKLAKECDSCHFALMDSHNNTVWIEQHNE